MTEDTGFDPRDVTTEFRMTMIDPLEPLMTRRLSRAAQDEMPGLKVQFLSVYGSDFLADLFSGRSHVAMHYFQRRVPQIRAEPLITAKLVCVARRGWVERNGPLDRAAFDRAPCTALTQSLRA